VILPHPPWYDKLEQVLLSGKPVLLLAGGAIVVVTGWFMYRVAFQDKGAVPMATWLTYLYMP
jgi:hypothetical protein